MRSLFKAVLSIFLRVRRKWIILYESISRHTTTSEIVMIASIVDGDRDVCVNGISPTSKKCINNDGRSME